MKRQANDEYHTRPGITKALTDRICIYGRVLEPCNGRGHITSTLTSRSIVTNDINPERSADFHCDATDPEAEIWDGRHYDWVITNPPFSEAHKILPIAFEHADIGVAFLLRLSYLEPTMSRNVRGDWLDKHADQMTNLIILGNPRPSFPPYQRNTDSVTSAWMVWHPDFSWRKEHDIESPFWFANNWKLR